MPDRLGPQAEAHLVRARLKLFSLSGRFVRVCKTVAKLLAGPILLGRSRDTSSADSVGIKTGPREAPSFLFPACIRHAPRAAIPARNRESETLKVSSSSSVYVSRALLYRSQAVYLRRRRESAVMLFERNKMRTVAKKEEKRKPERETRTSHFFHISFILWLDATKGSCSSRPLRVEAKKVFSTRPSSRARFNLLSRLPGAHPSRGSLGGRAREPSRAERAALYLEQLNCHLDIKGTRRPVRG